MHRFFVDPELITQTQTGLPLLLPDKLAHQVRDVLHLAVNEQLLLLDNSGNEYLARISRSARDGVEVLLEEKRLGKSEGDLRIILCQGLLKSARFEWILEKGTELGVSTFIPTIFRRSTAGLEEAGPAKLQRWQRIIQEATEQCSRARRPELLAIRPFIHSLKNLPTGALSLIHWEEEQEQSLRSALQTFAKFPSTEPKVVVLFIGPEGGLLPEEVQLAQQYGVQSVSLGPRILRAETAAIAAIANTIYELDGSASLRGKS